MKNQITLTSLIVIGIIAMLSIVVIGSKNNKEASPAQKQEQVSTISANLSISTPIFFYGNTCPHCADVEEWMKVNKINEKISVVKKEVYENRENAEELSLVASKCGLPTDSIGVPFLYVEGKCFVGSPDVISYLSSEMGIDSIKKE